MKKVLKIVLLASIITLIGGFIIYQISFKTQPIENLVDSSLSEAEKKPNITFLPDLSLSLEPQTTVEPVETKSPQPSPKEIIYPRYLAMEECQGINDIQTSEKIIALTFDDGPSEKYTKEILLILKKYNIKATFFMIGRDISPNSELVKEIFENGHIIGNHSFSHQKFTTISEKNIKEELKKTSEEIQKLTGKYPILFRPPYGRCSVSITKLIKQLGYKIITWSAITNDYQSGITAENIRDDIIRKVQAGGIIVLHDGGGDRPETVKALPMIIETLQKDGYSFFTIPELLNIEAYLPTPNIIDKILSWGHHSPSMPRFIDTIVIHSSYDALGNNPYSVDGVIKEYETYDVSPHYLIARDGAIYRLAPDKNIAYHAGTSKMPDGRSNVNNFSIGIELINKKSEGPNEIQYDSLVNLVKFLKLKYKINYILGHSQIAPARKTDPWNFDWQKFDEKLNK